ncbi:MAG: hypothetical protein ABFE08_24165 [Armatimonadia bacterium]
MRKGDGSGGLGWPAEHVRDHSGQSVGNENALGAAADEREASEHPHRPQRDDERVYPQVDDEQAIEQPADEADPQAEAKPAQHRCAAVKVPRAQCQRHTHT